MADLRELVKEIERKRARGEVTDVDEETFNAMDAAQGLSGIEETFKKPRDPNAPRKTSQQRMKEAMSGLNNMKKGGKVSREKPSFKKTSMW